MEEYAIEVYIWNAELSLGIQEKNAGSLTTWVIKALRTEVNASTWDNVNPVWDPKRNLLCILIYVTSKMVLPCVFLLLKQKCFFFFFEFSLRIPFVLAQALYMMQKLCSCNSTGVWRDSAAPTGSASLFWWRWLLLKEEERVNISYTQV